MIQTVGVIGAGIMGRGVSIDLLLHGFSVVITDISEAILTTAKEEIIRGVRFAPLNKKELPRMEEDEFINKIHFETDLQQVKNCDFIIENVTEEVNLKKEIYKKLDKVCSPEVVFGINTSCISITDLASVTNRVNKIIGIHFMNPVYLKPCVEVIKGFYTSEETLRITTNFLMQMDKEAVIVNDLPGFVSNRISHLFMNEAAFVVQDQVAKPVDVDAIFKKCYGHIMGPLETADLIGLDTVVYSLDVLYQSYQDPKFRCCPLLKKMVNAGLKGRKTGEGFYKY